MTVAGVGYWCRTPGHGARTREVVDTYVRAVIRARLIRPDIAQAFAPVHTSAGREAVEESRRLHARLETVEADYDAGHIDGRRYAAAVERISAELLKVDTSMARPHGTEITSLLTGGDPGA